MMDARFSAIGDRLLPEKNLRPPLQADSKKKTDRNQGRRFPHSLRTGRGQAEIREQGRSSRESGRRPRRPPSLPRGRRGKGLFKPPALPGERRNP